MRILEIYVITCYEEIYLNGIPTVGNLTEINSISETRKLRGNVTVNGMHCLTNYSVIWLYAVHLACPIAAAANPVFFLKVVRCPLSRTLHPTQENKNKTFVVPRLAKIVDKFSHELFLAF